MEQANLTINKVFNPSDPTFVNYVLEYWGATAENGYTMTFPTDRKTLNEDDLYNAIRKYMWDSGIKFTSKTGTGRINSFVKTLIEYTYGSSAIAINHLNNDAQYMELAMNVPDLLLKMWNLDQEKPVAERVIAAEDQSPSKIKYTVKMRDEFGEPVTRMSNQGDPNKRREYTQTLKFSEVARIDYLSGNRVPAEGSEWTAEDYKLRLMVPASPLLIYNINIDLGNKDEREKFTDSRGQVRSRRRRDGEPKLTQIQMERRALLSDRSTRDEVCLTPNIESNIVPTIRTTTRDEPMRRSTRRSTRRSPRNTEQAEVQAPPLPTTRRSTRRTRRPPVQQRSVSPAQSPERRQSPRQLSPVRQSPRSPVQQRQSPRQVSPVRQRSVSPVRQRSVSPVQQRRSPRSTETRQSPRQLSPVRQSPRQVSPTQSPRSPEIRQSPRQLSPVQQRRVLPVNQTSESQEDLIDLDNNQGLIDIQSPVRQSPEFFDEYYEEDGF
jgi:hypothetical protein